MSENENQPPAPSHQTSSVPLKKETVRVTLKAADAPPAAPSGSTEPVAPAKPPVPVAPPAPTVPPVGGAPRPPAPAPTIPLRTAGAPTAVGAPAPTIRLATSTAPVGAGTSALRPGGAGLAPGGTPTTGLPKATVQLQPPTQFASPSQMATLRVEEEEESEGGEGVANALAIAGFVAALVVLVLQLMTASVWINAEDNAQQGAWSQLLD